MILLFGPAGAGKSVQGQLVTKRFNVKWLSTGQALRESEDKDIRQTLVLGELVSNDIINNVLEDELNIRRGSQILLDGYPRTLEQAEWLVKNAERFDQKIDIVLMLEIPDEELVERLSKRSRSDDSEENARKRIKHYRENIEAINSYLTSSGIKIVAIDGIGKVEDIHERISSVLIKNNLVERV